MENLGNFFEFIRLFLILIVGGTVFKACISLIQGKKIEINPKNPLNLKARWPVQKKDKTQK
tara:strand:- start:1453 stop:1635 length:183 start_codon:yes stop_codon:yes gene_type:complete